MSQLRVNTQGISMDMLTANGDYDTIDRGVMTPEQLVEMLKKVQSLKEPDYDSGDDLCPPGVYIEGPAGDVGIYLMGGGLFEVETETPVTPFQGAMIAAGEKNIDEISESGPGPQASRQPPPLAQEPSGPAVMVPVRPGFFRRFFAFCAAAIPAFFGIGGMAATAQSDSQYSVILTVGIAIVTFSFVRLVYSWVRGGDKLVPAGSGRGSSGTYDQQYYGHTMMHDSYDDDSDSGSDWGGDDGGGGDFD